MTTRCRVALVRLQQLTLVVQCGSEMVCVWSNAGIASFQPKSKGMYTVEVNQDGKAIAGSPFKINIDDHHVTSGQKVKVAGHIKDAMANQWNDVTVNIADAGALSVPFLPRDAMPYVHSAGVRLSHCDRDTEVAR